MKLLPSTMKQGSFTHTLQTTIHIIDIYKSKYFYHIADIDYIVPMQHFPRFLHTCARIQPTAITNISPQIVYICHMFEMSIWSMYTYIHATYATTAINYVTRSTIQLFNIYHLTNIVGHRYAKRQPTAHVLHVKIMLNKYVHQTGHICHICKISDGHQLYNNEHCLHV